MRTAPWILLAAVMVFLTLDALPARAQLERRLPGAGIQLASGATASPLTLVVPLRLENIQPEIVMVNLQCRVVTSGLTTALGEARGISIPTSGDLTQDVNVPITFPDGADPREYTNYQCQLTLCTATMQCSAPSSADPFRITSGSEIVQGTVNW